MAYHRRRETGTEDHIPEINKMEAEGWYPCSASYRFQCFVAIKFIFSSFPANVCHFRPENVCLSQNLSQILETFYRQFFCSLEQLNIRNRICHCFIRPLHLYVFI